MTLPSSFRNLKVECRAGVYGDPEPLKFLLGQKQVEIIEVIDRWLSSDLHYFKVTADDGGIYILRHEPPRCHWELTLYDRGLVSH